MTRRPDLAGTAFTKVRKVKGIAKLPEQGGNVRSWCCSIATGGEFEESFVRMGEADYTKRSLHR
jgi:hypothetical protein